MSSHPEAGSLHGALEQLGSRSSSSCARPNILPQVTLQYASLANQEYESAMVCDDSLPANAHVCTRIGP
jgi:hypothetical protein